MVINLKKMILNLYTVKRVRFMWQIVFVRLSLDLS